VERFITRGREEGATLACGGRRPPHLSRGYYVEPTLFTDARNDMTIAREEIFGPVITAIPFRDEAEAIALANESDYGLYGYVWTGDAARGLRVAHAVRTGTMQINGSPLTSASATASSPTSAASRAPGGRSTPTASSSCRASSTSTRTTTRSSPSSLSRHRPATTASRRSWPGTAATRSRPAAPRTASG